MTTGHRESVRGLGGPFPERGPAGEGRPHVWPWESRRQGQGGGAEQASLQGEAESCPAGGVGSPPGLRLPQGDWLLL